MRLIKNITKMIDCKFFRGQKRLMLLVFIALLSMGMQAQTSYTLGTGKDYTDLATAINACTTAGTTYTLTVYDNTVTLGATATMNTNTNITINIVSSASGTQRTITRTAAAGYVNISKGTLNMTDIVLDGDSANVVGSEAMIKVGTTSYNGTLTMTKCTIQKCKRSTTNIYGGALFIDTKGSVTLSNVNILGNAIYGSAANGGGIYNKGSLTFESTNTIRGNSAGQNGGGIYSSGTLTLNGSCSIIENNACISRTSGSSSYGGGGIYSSGTTNISATSADISHNSSLCGGGGIYVAGGTFTIDDNLTITNNICTTYYGYGGGMHISKGTVNISGTTISKNETTSGGGGGIYVEGNSSTTIVNFKTKKSIIGSSGNPNKAQWGGGIYVYGLSTNSAVVNFDVEVDITYNECSRNSAGGGGLGIQGSACTVNFNVGPNISYNKQTVSGTHVHCNGGGISISNGTLNINATTDIHHNEASTAGGGISIGGGKLNINATTRIYDNQAAYGGGLGFDNGSSGRLSITNNTDTLGVLEIYQNTADTGGGIAILYNSSIQVKGSGDLLKIHNNTANDIGGGIYYTTGTINIGNDLNIDIYNNTAGNDGGGLYYAIKITGNKTIGNIAKIRNNTATAGKGGGIYYKGQSGYTTTFPSGMEVSGNVSGTDGGGIYLDSFSIILQGVIIKSNTATGNGGGIYVAIGDTLNFETTASTIGGSVANKNTAVDGAGLYVNGGSATFSVSPNISYNEADGMGGGIAIAGGTVNVPVLTDLTYNQADNGGGVAVTGGTLTVTGTDTSAGLRLSGNTATAKGGGLYYTNGIITDNGKSNIVIYNNSAADGGGLYCAVSSAGAKTIGNIGMIRHNTASNAGGGIYYKGYEAASATTMSSNMTVRGNTATYYGGGVYVESHPLTFSNPIKIYDFIE